MKIIEVGTGYTPIPAKIGAATEIVIESLLREFSELGTECELLDITYEKDNSYKNELIHGATVNRIYLPRWLSAINDYGLIHYLRRVLYSFKVAFRLKKILKVDKGNTYIHFHNQFNYFIVYLFANKAIKKAAVKTIYTIHSPNWLLVNKIPNKYILEKRAIENCDYVVALTEKIKIKICNLIPSIDKNKINVIPNGVSSHFYHTIPNHLKDNTIANIGAICERKNQLTSISNLKEFLKEYSFKFRFAGKITEPEYFEKIKEYIAKNNLKDYVEYVGELKPGNELNTFYNKSKFYVSHSRQEAFSLVILEAMIAGAPVVLGDNFKDFLDEDCDLLEVIKFLNSEQLSPTLAQLCKNNREYNLYKKSQISFVNEKYNWNKVTLKLLAMLE